MYDKYTNVTLRTWVRWCVVVKADQLCHIYISVLCPSSQEVTVGMKMRLERRRCWSNVLCLVINENAEFPHVC